jgi:activator of 2-hydroxyglutaryl-CoA dehydratase
MTIKDVSCIIFDRVIIYKATGEDFEDIYKGIANDIPSNILDMIIRSIGTSKRGVVDICVR